MISETSQSAASESDAANAFSRLEAKVAQHKQTYKDARIDDRFADVVEFATVRAKEKDDSQNHLDEMASAKPPVNSNKQPSLSLPPTPSSNLIAYEFEDSLELAQILMPTVKFHGWQDEISKQLAAAKPTQHNPFKFCLTACNGSGKDAFVIAPFVVWFMLTRVNALAVVTSSSGVQLTSQTENLIARLCFAFNAWRGHDVFKIIKRHIRCLDTGSECRLFATDEPGKAEGYHPIEPNAEMAIVANEAKSIPDDIFEALTRCTGYNYWLEVSTPGEPQGHFYWSWKHYKSKKRVTSYECPHKNVEDIEEDKLRYGEHSALFRSKHLALFTQFSGQFVISQLHVDRCLEKCTTQIGVRWPKRVGIDIALSNGGDETVVCITQGNKRVAQLILHSDDITVLVVEISKFMEAEGVSFDSNYIFLDDGGVGRAAWPLLQSKGWLNVNRILNQFRAFNTVEFANRGAEMYFNAARFIEECVLFLPAEDKLFMEQLTTRKYVRSDQGGKMRLESKADMKSEGRRSPDRVDAMFLSFHGLTIENFHEALKNGDSSFVGSQEQDQKHSARAFSAKEFTTNAMSKPRDLDQHVNLEEFFSGKSSRQSNHSLASTISNLSTLCSSH